MSEMVLCWQKLEKRCQMEGVVIQPVPSEFDSHYLSSRLNVLESNAALQQLFHHQAPTCSMLGARQAGDPCS